MHRKELNLPPFESVRRTRQRWQESCPVLRGNNRKLKEIEALERLIPLPPFDKKFPGAIVHYCPRCGKKIECGDEE